MDFESDNFKKLFNKEKDIRDINGVTILMVLCSKNAHLLDS